jgi:superfamily II DNA/RNA helicase
MKSFRGGKFDILIATDLASRGIDVADISHIIQVDVPEDPEVYVHRVGRTARMGARGKAFTFITRDQGPELTKIESLINMIIPQGQVEGFVPRPTPADWLEEGAMRGGAAPGPAAPAEQPQGIAPHPTVTLKSRPLTIGSKIPLSRRHRRRR